MPIGDRRFTASCRCRRRRSSSGRSLSSFGRSKPACAFTSASLTLSRSVSILRPTLRGRVSFSSPAADLARFPKTMKRARSNRIAFQGEPGANSHLAARDAYPRMEALACPTFEDAIAAVKTGKAGLAMIPIENSVAGRVADIHHLLPHSGLHIVAVHFESLPHPL